MRKVVVLSSGGLDSTTCVALAIRDFGKENVITLSIVYGQKHSKELECAKRVAEYYGVEHDTLDLTNIFKKSKCSLLSSSAESISKGSYAEQIKESEDGIVSTYVPFRNGLMLSAVAAYAMSLHSAGDNIFIYIGAHADDVAGAAYADCSFQFMHAMDAAVKAGTYGVVGIKAPFIDMSKSEIVRMGLNLEVPYELTWSCYEGGKEACGTCGTCKDRLKAFERAGVTDPIKYKNL